MQTSRHGFGLTALGRSLRDGEEISSRGTRRIGRVLGIPFFVSFSAGLYLLVTFVAYMMWYVHYATIATGLIFVVTSVLFLSIVIHEFAHALITKALGGSCSSVSIDGLGGVAECSHFTLLSRSLVVILVGPLTHLLWVAVAVIAMLVGGKWDVLTPNVNIRHPDFEAFGWQVANAIYIWQLVCFVLSFLPILPTSDGSRMVQVLVARCNPRVRNAFYVSWGINLVCFIGFVIVYVFCRGPLQCLVFLLVVSFLLGKREWEIMLHAEREVLTEDPDNLSEDLAGE